MKGRLYDARLGRFITPDPFVTEPLNPQGLNRYAYVNNNPLNFVDPSGFEECPVITLCAEKPDGTCEPLPPMPDPNCKAQQPQPPPTSGSSPPPGSGPPPGTYPDPNVTPPEHVPGGSEGPQYSPMVGGSRVGQPGIRDEVPLFGQPAQGAASCQELSQSNNPAWQAWQREVELHTQTVPSLATRQYWNLLRIAAGLSLLATAQHFANEIGPVPVGLEGRAFWGRAETLADHFARHGADVGAATAESYAQSASRLLVRSQVEGLPTKIDASGIIRVYDPANNLFGAFNPDGTARTLLSPTRGAAYFAEQPGVSPWLP